MGCTSSSPNMVTPKSNTAEKCIQFEGDVSDEESNGVEEIIYRAEENGKTEINVLPSSCDNLMENLHVVRNKSTISLQPEKDNNIGIYKNNNSIDTSMENEDKIPKLKEVVEKVVEQHIDNVDDSYESHNLHPKNEDEQKKEVKDNYDSTKKKSEKENYENSEKEFEEVLAQGQMDEQLVEPISPSQSESSRATRWEALADIAAELPASLAVDPITGQIYALSK